VIVAWNGFVVGLSLNGARLSSWLHRTRWHRQERRVAAKRDVCTSAWAVNGARLAVAAPWLVLLFLSFQPDVIQRYSSASGVVVLLGGAAACVLAYRVMLRIGRLPTERRILR